ncbi:MAG: hypothetical protein ACRD0I_11840 [Acidimicrobiales bacterium]
MTLNRQANFKPGREGLRPRGAVVKLALMPAVILALLVSACGGAAPGSKATTGANPAGSNHSPRTAAPASPPTAFQATLAPWQLPAPVSRPVALSDGSGLVVMGGLTASDTSTSAILKIDPAKGQVSRIGDLAQASHDAGGAVLGGRFVVFGGGAVNVHDAVQAFSPASGTTKVISHLAGPRADLSVATVNGVAYVVGGFDGTTLNPNIVSSTNGVDFHTVAQLPHPVRYIALAALGPYLWVIGGTDGTNATTDIQRIDTRNGSAQIVGHTPVPLDHAVAVVLDGTIVIMGGVVGGKPSAAIWRLDTTNNTLVPAGTLPYAVSMPGAATVGGAAYLVGGEGPSPLSTVMVVRPR